MSRTMVLAVNTFREAIRDRLTTTVLLFGGVMMASAVILAPLTLGEETRLVRDLGLASISLFSMLAIILVGTGMVYREIQLRTIHTILSLPVHRAEFILGKFFGLYATILFAIGVLSVVYLAVVALFGGGIHGNLFFALALAALEAMIVTAVAIFFSTVASPLLSAVFTFCVFLAGHLIGSIRVLIQHTEAVGLRVVVDTLYVVFPSLHQFDVRNNVLADIPVPPEQLLYCAAYTILYTGALLVVTVVLFGRRDFE